MQEKPVLEQNSTLEQLPGQLESLLHVQLSPDSSVEEIRASFRLNKFRVATVLVTRSGEIYLSDKPHSSMKRALDIDAAEPVGELYVGPDTIHGPLKVHFDTGAFTLKEVFRNPMNKVWLLGRDDEVVSAFEDVIGRKVLAFLDTEIRRGK